MRQIDSKIQAFFDALFHWLMRTFEMPKRTLRYRLWTAQLLRALAGPPVGIATGTLTGVALVGVLGLAFVQVTLFVIMRSWDREDDEDAERHGTVSVADVPRGVKPIWWTIAGIQVGLMFMGDSNVVSDWARFYSPGLDSFLWLALEYLKGTPNLPERVKDSE